MDDRASGAKADGALAPPTLDEIRAARHDLQGLAWRTPLVPLGMDVRDGSIHLKLECLQSIGSFKIRGAGHALARASGEDLRGGVVTASAGNMAQGVAACARERGVACTVVAPETAPRAKLDAIERLGARTIPVSHERWWRTLSERRHPGVEGFFVHPVADRAVMAGNGTIALEVLEDLPDVETVLVPFGGGGLLCGIASGLRSSARRVRVVACEVETAAPLAASLEAGRPTAIEHRRSFVDGMGGRSVLEEMWPLLRELVDDVVVVSLREIAEAMRLLVARNHVVAEGAGAAPLAAALSGRAGAGTRACIVSGGNVDASTLAAILMGETPG